MTANKTFTRAEIETQVRQILSNYLQVDQSEIQANQHVVNDLGADSLDLTELVTALEDMFEIEISDADFNQLTTVGGMDNYLEGRLLAEEAK